MSHWKKHFKSSPNLSVPLENHQLSRGSHVHQGLFSDIFFRAVASWQEESKGEDEIDRALLAGFDQQILGVFRGRDAGWKERRSVERMKGT